MGELNEDRDDNAETLPLPLVVNVVTPHLLWVNDVEPLPAPSSPSIHTSTGSQEHTRARHITDVVPRSSGQIRRAVPTLSGHTDTADISVQGVFRNDQHFADFLNY